MPFVSRPIGSFAAVFLLVSSSAVVACTVTSTTTPQPEGATPETPATAVENVPQPITPADTAATSVTKLPELPPPSTGDWVKPNPKGKSDGEACKKPDDCKSGVCEGMGCDTGPKCVPADRMCTRDMRTYCGCDDKPFGGSGSCPGRPFKNKGDCAK